MLTSMVGEERQQTVNRQTARAGLHNNRTRVRTTQAGGHKVVPQQQPAASSSSDPAPAYLQHAARVTPALAGTAQPSLASAPDPVPSAAPAGQEGSGLPSELHFPRVPARSLQSAYVRDILVDMSPVAAVRATTRRPAAWRPPPSPCLRSLPCAGLVRKRDASTFCLPASVLAPSIIC